MSLPNPCRFVAVKRPDWNGQACYHIYDENGEHIATMSWSPYWSQYTCQWHRGDQWDTPYRSWQLAITEVES